MDISDDPLELTRGLLTTTASVRHGYLDVLGESTASPVPTLAQRAMNSALVATVYERLWRPVAFYVASGVTTGAEQRRASEALPSPGSVAIARRRLWARQFHRAAGPTTAR